MNIETVKTIAFLAWGAHLLMGFIIGQNKGKPGVTVLLAALFGPIGLIAALSLSPTPEILEEQAEAWLKAKEAVRKKQQAQS